MLKSLGILTTLAWPSINPAAVNSWKSKFKLSISFVGTTPPKGPPIWNALTDLFNPPPVKTDTKTNPRRRGGGGDGIGRRGNNQLSNSLPSGLNLIGSTTTGTNQFSNGTLDNVLPNINDVLNLAGMNENFDDFNEDVDVSNTKKSPLLPN